MAAGFDKNCRYLSALGSLGFGYVVGGTVTRAPRTGNAKPRTARVPRELAVLNAMGFPNHGADAARAELQGLVRRVPILVSLDDERVDDVIASHELLEPYVDGVELNVSCPNVSWGKDEQVEQNLRNVLRRLAPAKRKPIFVKIPPYRSDRERSAILRLVRIGKEEGADALTATNARAVSSRLMAVGRAGLSGAPNFNHTTRIVRDLFNETAGELPINACGGVFSAADALACLRAGATTVQVYTGLIYEGPRIVRRITEGLSHELSAVRSVSDLVGADA
jgi:dihydroorotate dehydrogenase